MPKFILGIMAGVAFVSMLAIALMQLLPNLRDTTIVKLGGVTETQQRKEIADRIAMAELDWEFDNTLNQDAVFFDNLEITKVECRAGITSFIQKMGFEIEFSHDDIIFTSSTENPLTIGLVRCAGLNADNTIDLEVAVASRRLGDSKKVLATMEKKIREVWNY